MNLPFPRKLTVLGLKPALIASILGLVIAGVVTIAQSDSAKIVGTGKVIISTGGQAEIILCKKLEGVKYDTELAGCDGKTQILLAIKPNDEPMTINVDLSELDSYQRTVLEKFIAEDQKVLDKTKRAFIEGNTLFMPVGKPTIPFSPGLIVGNG